MFREAGVQAHYEPTLGEAHAAFPKVAMRGKAAASQTSALVPGRYGADRHFNITALSLSLLFSVGLLLALTTLGVISTGKAEHHKLIVVDLQTPPPPPPPPQPKPRPDHVPTPQSPVVAPIPVVRLPAPAPEITTSPAPAPHDVVVPGPPSPAPQPAPPAIESVGDMSSNMIAAPSPRYPRESRLHREEGTVILLVILGTDGRVADISISRSSGFKRLDQSALSAVRRWRWSPTIRGGVPVMVKGRVEIPFILTGK